MPELTDRGKAFRAAIAAFVGMKLEKKPKDAQGNFASADETECDVWLSGAIENVPKIYRATHVLKATHPKAVGSDIHAPLRIMSERSEIGTHSVAEIDDDIIASTAAYLGASSFLRADAEGRRFLDWIRINDPDFCAALHPDEAISETWMETLRSLGPKQSKPSSHPMAKQVYWLVGDDPQDDEQYHLLQPMFSSSLAHAVHADIQAVRFGEANKQARQAFRDRQPAQAVYSDYRNLVARKLGGTKPQNISQLNSERRGINYLLSSLPPPAWQADGRSNVAKQKSVFEVFLWFQEVRTHTKALADHLLSVQDKTSTIEIRDVRDGLLQNIIEQLALFGTVIRERYPVGWTRADDCQLPLSERLWLDPERADRDHPEWRPDDEAFSAEYDRGDWADDVATRFGLWLNDQLRKAELPAMALPELKHWVSRLLIDVAWPTPLRRRAKVEVIS